MVVQAIGMFYTRNQFDSQQTHLILPFQWWSSKKAKPKLGTKFATGFKSLMSYESQDERSMHNTNPDEWQPSCCLDPCIQQHHSLLRPGAHCWDFDNCLCHIMEIEEKALDKKRWRSQDIYIQTWWMDLYAFICQPTGLECDKVTSFIAQTSWVVVAQKQWGLEAFGCKSIYTDTIYWLSIITICILCAIIEHPMTVSMSLWWASTERQWLLVLPIPQSNGCMVKTFQRGTICWLCR